MPYRLRENLSFCIAGDRVVFLDVVGDRYFCLDPMAELSFRELITGQHPGDAISDHLKPLLDQHLLILDDNPSIRPPTGLSIADSSMLDAWDRRAAATALPRALISQTYWAVHYKRRGFSQCLDLVRAMKRAAVAANDRPQRNSVRQIVSSHLLCGRLTRSRDRCLPRSLALVTALLRAGCNVDLVFGVTTTPFAAHCWVQHEREVLNDALDHSRRFTPILVL